MSSECGRRTCSREADVTYTTTRGALRSRCDVHALADGVDGIGEKKAETLLEAFDLEDLVDTCEGADGRLCPVSISKLDGFRPTSAKKVAEAIDSSAVARSVRKEADR